MRFKFIPNLFWTACILAGASSFVQAQHLLQQRQMIKKSSPIVAAPVKGHSHNDYEQDRPFYAAYDAGMESMEADVYLRDGILYVAHDAAEIEQANSLEQLYLLPLVKALQANQGYVFDDKAKSLQLMIDIKEDHVGVLQALTQLIASHPILLTASRKGDVLKVVISGDRPAPANFPDYPDWLFFDGLLDQRYTKDQLKRVALFSADFKLYSSWGGLGSPTEQDKEKIKAVLAIAQKEHLPFRFWGNPDQPDTWRELARLGVYWINTDQPAALTQLINNMTIEQ